MKVIGLTGGIGAGKSTVSNYLKNRGIAIFDSDKIAREITEPGSPVLGRLCDVFGEEILFEDGSLNRRKLGNIAFSTKENRKILDQITHGEIISRTLEGLAEARRNPDNQVAVIDAPLLFEAGLDKYADVIWVVDACDDVRVMRLKKRDGLSEAEIYARINNQMGREEKLCRANHVLNNSGNEEALYQQIDALLKEYV